MLNTSNLHEGYTPLRLRPGELRVLRKSMPRPFKSQTPTACHAKPQSPQGDSLQKSLRTSVPGS